MKKIVVPIFLLLALSGCRANVYLFAYEQQDEEAPKNRLYHVETEVVTVVGYRHALDRRSTMFIEHHEGANGYKFSEDWVKISVLKY